MRLTAPQIAGYASGAGFHGTDLVIAVAVALAESGGETTATNHDADGTTDYGVWQINSVHSELFQSGRWDNPADNARMAYTVWRGSGWTAWTTYNNGDYRAHLTMAHSAAGSPTSPVSFVSFVGGGSHFPRSRRAPRAPFGPHINTWARPGLWFNFYGFPIPPPPMKYVNVTKTKTAIPGLAGRTMPAGSYVFQLKSGPGIPAPGTPHDQIPADIERWLQLYWVGDFTREQARQDDIWLFSYTLAEQPKIKFYPEGSPDPGRATPGIGPNPLGNPLDFLAKLVAFLTNPHNWLRLAMFIVGAALVLFGAYKLGGVRPPSAIAAVGEAVS